MESDNLDELTPNNEQLLEIAATNPPPASWYAEPVDPFEAKDKETAR